MFGSSEAARSPRGVTSPDESPRDSEKVFGAPARGDTPVTASVDELRQWISRIETEAESVADARWGRGETRPAEQLGGERCADGTSANPWGQDDTASSSTQKRKQNKKTIFRGEYSTRKKTGRREHGRNR